MDKNEFFSGAQEKQSVLSVITGACVDQLSSLYRALPDGQFSLSVDGLDQGALSESEMRHDVAQWIKGLTGEDFISKRIVMLVRSNPGWEVIITNRVIKEMRRWAS